MKRNYFLMFMVVGLALCACTRKDPLCGCAPPYQVTYLKAKVIETNNIDCKRPLLSFEEDSIRIALSSGLEGKTKFIVTDLPPAFNQLNKTLYVLVRPMTAGTDFPCTTLGISYPHIQLTDAKER